MGIEALDRLNEALAALSSVDVAELTDDEVHQLCIGTQRARERVGATAGLATAVWDARRVWAANQCLSPQQRLSNELKCDIRTARRELRRARKLVHMPHTADALPSPDHAIARSPTRDEPQETS